MPQIHYHTTNYSLAYPEEGRLGGSNPIESSDFLNCVCKIYCPTPRSAPILIKSYILYRKTLKIVSKFQNLLQLLGDFVSQGSSPLSREPLHCKILGTSMQQPTTTNTFRCNIPVSVYIFLDSPTCNIVVHHYSKLISWIQA